MRLYIIDQTEKAYLLKSISFKERWLPKKGVSVDFNIEREGIYGKSYEMTIDFWALNR